MILDVLSQIVPYVIVTAVFTFMYSFIPNTQVQFRAALIGGVTAGIMWALVGKVFTAVILYSSQLVAVYTGFAIVLTTLIWVYLSWLILLIGAQLAFYVQFPQYLRHGQEPIELTGCDCEQMAVSIMVQAAVFGLLVPGIDNYAHLGGFAGGYLTSALLNPMTRERGDHIIVAIGCLVATALAIVASIVTGLPPFR